MKSEIKITADGSSTLFIPDLNEYYHSMYGAVQESEYVFLQMGLESFKHKNITLFEFGFGTGLNALLTFLKSDEYSYIEYHTMELYPLKWQVIEKLDFPEFLKLTKVQTALFKMIHRSPWEELVPFSKNFSLKKNRADIRYQPFDCSYDLVYFDAFAPSVQPELWGINIFRKLFNAMNKDACLVTYCAKGEVRRNMQHAGFTVERLPGPEGKREILRAKKLKD